MNKSSLDLTRLFRAVSPYQVKLLLQQLAHASLASNIAAVYISIVLWPVAVHRWLVIWLAFILSISILRGMITFLFQNRKPADTDLKPWQLSSLLLIIIAGAAWGSLAFMYDFNWPVYQQFAVISVLFIMALGSIPAYATILPVYVISLITILTPVTVIFLISDVENFPIYGIGLFSLGLLLYSLARRYRDSVIHEIGHNLFYRDAYLELKKSYEDLDHELEDKKTEEKVARAIYTRIAKLKPINKDGIRGSIEPMGQFSGDFIFSARTPDGYTYILFADFSGHGLSAALGAIPVSSIFYSMTAKGLAPAQIIQELNTNLHAQLSTNQFCCACFVALNPARDTLELWNGGMPDVMVVNEKRIAVSHLQSTHIPLGIEVSTDQSEYTLDKYKLLQGDLVFIYSDGLIEVTDKSDENFSQRRVEEILLNHYKDPDLLERIKTRIDEFSQGMEQKDDISMLEIRC